MYRTLIFPLQIDDTSSYLTFMEQCSKMFNQYVDWALENKSWNKLDCHSKTYQTMRNNFSEIPSAIIQTVRDMALESVKATKLKRCPRKRKYSSIRYDQRTLTLRGQQLTLSKTGKRLKTILNIHDYQKEIFKNGKCVAAQICYIESKNQFLAKLQFKLEPPEQCQNTNVIGIDRGIYNIATLSNGTNIDSKQVRKQQRKFLHLRSNLQAKGTPSAKRKLKQLSGKEKRFSKDFNHQISKQIVNLNAGTFVLEDLSQIRKQKTYSKKANKWLSSWAFFQLETFLIYKAEGLGKKVVKIDPRYTSQKCSICGHIEKHNRNKSKFKCLRCGYTNHSDLNAAINIRDNYILSVSQKNETIEQADVNPPYTPTT